MIKKNRFLQVILWVFSQFTIPNIHYGLLGDVEEMYLLMVQKSRFRANVWFVGQLIKMIPSLLYNVLFWRCVMIRNYLKTALRNIGRFSMYSFINVTGLTIGLTVFVMIFLFVHHELSYDRFHEHMERTYRIEQIRENGEIIPLTPAPLARLLMDAVPEIIHAVRIKKAGGHLYYQDRIKFYENRGLYTEAAFFDIFTHPLIQGDPSLALKDPFSIVLTQEYVKKFFGHADPMGKTLRFQKNVDLTVTGVLEDIPDNSHMQFDFIISLSTLEALYGRDILMSWDRDDTYHYILTSHEHIGHGLHVKIQNFMNEYREETNRSVLNIMPLSRIHLYSNTNYEIYPTMPYSMVLILAGLGLLTLFIACINSMNLTMALSSNRSREVGIRKVVGSERSQLVHQFLMESILLSFVSLIVAFLLVSMLLPVFNRLLDKSLDMQLLFRGTKLLQLCLIGLIVGLFSGLQPAFTLSSLKSVDALKNTIKSGTGGKFLKKVLVTSQFVFSIIFIILSIVWYQLGQHARHMDLGFETENIFVMPLNKFSRSNIDNLQIFEDELKINPNILCTSVSTDLPYSIYAQTEVGWEGSNTDEKTWVTCVHWDEDFKDLYHIRLVSGRHFSTQFSTDITNACLINETAARVFGYSENAALGKWIEAFGKRSQVVGVVKNFHSTDLRLAIKPLLVHMHRAEIDGGDFISIKVNPVNIHSTFEFIDNRFKKIFPDEINDFSLLETRFFRTFVTFDNFNKLFASISLLAVTVALMGLFALVSFSVNRRTKEIGIRKVLGATVNSVLVDILKEFTKLVIIADLIAWPLAYFLASGMLQQFAYSMGVNVWMFLLVGFLGLVLALLTAGIQAVKGATVNPVDSLRYE